MPATVLAESLELSTRRAREQADDLAGVRTGRALGPGALAWHLLIVDPEGAPPAQLCGRPGWHTPHMFDALRLKAPTRPTTDNDALLQSATDSRNYGKLVRAESASAEAQLRQAAAALEPAEAGQAVPMVLKLVSLAEARGTRLPTRDTDERQQALLEALGRLGLGADEYVRKRFDLTKHEARAQVKGGRNGGQHSQQLVHVVWLLDDNTVLFSPTHRLEQLAGDKQPAIQSAEEQDDDSGLRLIVFGCGSTSVLVAPPKNWNGKQPKVQRASSLRQRPVSSLSPTCQAAWLTLESMCDDVPGQKWAAIDPERASQWMLKVLELLRDTRETLTLKHLAIGGALTSARSWNSGDEVMARVLKCRHDHQGLVDSVLAVKQELAKSGRPALTAIRSYLVTVRPPPLVPLPKAISIIVPPPPKSRGTATPDSFVQRLTQIIYSQATSSDQVIELRKLRLEGFQPHHYRVILDAGRIMARTFSSRLQTTFLEGWLRSINPPTVPALLERQLQSMHSFQALLWEAMPQAAPVQPTHSAQSAARPATASSATLSYKWSNADNRVLWEARFKVGTARVETWPQTAARFQYPTRTVAACKTQLGRLNPDGSNTAPFSWKTLSMRLNGAPSSAALCTHAVAGDTRPALAPPPYAPPLKRVATHQSSAPAAPANDGTATPRASGGAAVPAASQQRASWQPAIVFPGGGKAATLTLVTIGVASATNPQPPTTEASTDGYQEMLGVAARLCSVAEAAAHGTLRFLSSETFTHTIAALADLSRITLDVTLAYCAPRLLVVSPPPAWLVSATISQVVSATGALRTTFESPVTGRCCCWVATAVLCTVAVAALGWMCVLLPDRLLTALPRWGETALCFALQHATGDMGWDPATVAFVALGIVCALLESRLLLRRRPLASYVLHALRHLAHAYGKPLPLALSELPLTFLRAGMKYALARYARARLARAADALLAAARHRRVLGLAASGAEDGTARKAWRQKTRSSHPDKNLHTGTVRHTTSECADMSILKEARDALEALHRPG